MYSVTVQRFEEWRAAARALLVNEIPPQDVHWQDGWQKQASFLATSDNLPTGQGTSFSVPREFLALARSAAHHCDPARWSLLYCLLWRLTHGEAELLEVAVDPEVYQLQRLVKSVRRDEHKMHAFVRFTRTVEGDKERFLAWYQPDHHILRLAADFFVDRFRAMNWSIFTPEESAMWDGVELCYGPGVPRSAAPDDDELVALWQTYYASTFNPARLNPKMMRREMPVRFWPNLPEAALIPALTAAAEERTSGMLARKTAPQVSAADFLPPQRDFGSLVSAAACCRGCDLHANATQTVFGAGPVDAKIMFVGEQPGDQEDRAGQPFIGPAGKLLNEVLAEVGIERNAAFVTNAVKHFKWQPRGKVRLHAKPASREVLACRAWLDAELKLVQPKVLVLLGATAAQSLFGRTFRLLESRGRPFVSDFAPWTLATYHPAAVLRAASSDADKLRELFRADLQLAADYLSGVSFLPDIHRQ